MLTIFGVIAVSIMAAAYWLEDRSPWYTLIFAVASVATAIYSGLSEVYPIMVIEGIWSLMALQRFRSRRQIIHRAAPDQGDLAGSNREESRGEARILSECATGVAESSQRPDR
jgi:hypothetical protein